MFHVEHSDFILARIKVLLLRPCLCSRSNVRFHELKRALILPQRNIKVNSVVFNSFDRNENISVQFITNRIIKADNPLTYRDQDTLH
jgi:hypothetical protein